MSEKIILLTACVNPQGMSYCALQNGNIRLNQYKDAIFFYLSNTKYRIVVVDNSGFDFSNDFIDSINLGRLEVMCFYGNSYDKSRGKGYGELSIIDYTFKNSKFINENSYIIKITGRIIVSNINEIIDKHHLPSNILNVIGDISLNMKIIRSIIFGASYKFYTDFFFMNKDLINDSKNIFFEHALRYSVSQMIKNGKGKFIQIHTNIEYIGLSGTTGSIIINNNKMKQVIYNKIKSFLIKTNIKKINNIIN
jgi:hypothetical protein